jgi:hypothetical protein
MTKEQVFKLLQILDSNDCLHSEWMWAELDEDGEETGDLSLESEWLVEEIRKIISQPESIH